MKPLENQAQPVDVYLVSSTLHFFWAFMLASKNSGSRQSHLIAIDQYADKPLVMLEYLTEAISPFLSVHVLVGRELKGWAKLKNRRQQFAWIREFVASQAIDRVFIGNDRSVLGQYFIKQSKQKSPLCIACYLDDGVFSYQGRAASQNWAEKYVDAFFKKVTYGFWYDVPATVGASKWIDEVWVMYPELVNSYLGNKKKVEILPDNDGFSVLLPLSRNVFKGMDISLARINSLDVLITLPNETVFSKIEGYREKINGLISSLLKNQKNVAVKYHPAAGNQDLLGLEALGVFKLPSNVSFELFIPLLSQCLVIGDFSTTVLTTKYSGNVSVGMIQSGENREMRRLCDQLGIEIMNIDKLIHRIGKD